MSLLAKEEILSLLAHSGRTLAPPLYGKLIGDVDFTGHVFSYPAVFMGAMFTGRACFQHAQFQDIADFRNTVFSQDVCFDETRFERGAGFSKAVFRQAAHFSYCRFLGPAYFWRARFLGDVDFLQVLVYTQGNPEPDTIDPGETNFSWTWFMGKATFTRMQFHGPARFWRTLFFSDARFDETVFKGVAWFNGTRTEAQLSRFEFSNPPLLDALAREGFLRTDDEEIIEMQGRRLYVFFLFNGVASDQDLVEKLATLRGVTISRGEVEELRRVWDQGARAMFADPELVSFRGARFENLAETHFTDINLPEDALRKLWKEQAQRGSPSTKGLVPVIYVESGGTYVEKQTTINQSGTGNILNVAEYMQDVSNYVNNNLQNSSSAEEAKELVRRLTDQIKAISNQTDPELTEKMGKNVKKLSEEMAEPKPDRAWYELSLKGIQEAAEAVGAVAGPITTTVGKLMRLLLGV